MVGALVIGGIVAGSFQGSNQAEEIALNLVYTAPTANDADFALPAETKAALREIGLAHRKIALTRIDSTAETSTTLVDLTPRAGDRDPVIEVRDRAMPVIDAKIAQTEKAINSSPASTGSRALYAGLTRIDFSGAPIVIGSSGLDLANPTDFRALNWAVPAQKVVANVKKAGAQAAIHGPVTFVVVPSAGAQDQLSHTQKEYRNDTWRALLAAAGATSVTFLDATGTASSSATPAPTVPVPRMPTTPIKPETSAANPSEVSCTLSESYFVVNTATLIDREQTRRNLGPCIKRAARAHSSFAIDGWTSYIGPLDARGRPVIDRPEARRLSVERVNTIADLLINEFGIPPASIPAGSRNGHGNVNQPDPNPESEKNRVVVVTYHLK